MENFNHSQVSRASRLRQPDLNGTGPWGKVPLWITTAPISDRAVRLFAFYSSVDFNGDGRIDWSFAKTDDALHWGMDATKRARQELVRIEAISVEPRWNKHGRLADEITLNFTQPGAKRAPMPPPKRAPMPYGTDKSTDRTSEVLSSEVQRSKLRRTDVPRKPLGVTDSRQEGTSAPLAQLYKFQHCDEDEVGHAYKKRCKECVDR
jgi:hypothetical protein